MSWIESHQELARHPKTKRLARVLHEPEVAVIGRLHCLWWWALDYADDGDLSGMDASDIADACQWEGDAAAFIAAMVRVRFLDQDGSGLRIHDWEDYAGRLVEKRRQNIARVRRWRADNGNRTNGTDTHTEHAYVTHNESVAPQRPLLTHREAHAPPPGSEKNGAVAGESDVTHNERVRYTATVPYRTGPDSTGPDRGGEARGRAREAAPRQLREKVLPPDLTPLVAAFRGRGLPPLTFLGTDAVDAGALLAAGYGPEQVAACWADHASGAYGGELDRQKLSFGWLIRGSPIRNWVTWQAKQDGAPPPVPRRGGYQSIGDQSYRGLERLPAGVPFNIGACTTRFPQGYFPPGYDPQQHRHLNTVQFLTKYGGGPDVALLDAAAE